MVLLVLAKVLAPSEFGILAIAALTYNVLLVLNHLGIGDALTYLKDRVEEASRTALSMVLAAGLVLMGITWALSPAIAQFFHIPDAVFVLRGFAVALPFDAAAQIPIARITRSLSFARRSVTDSLGNVIGGAVTIGVVVGGHPLVGLVAGQIAGAVVGLATAMIIGPWCLPGWNPALARQLLRYGGYLSAADILNLGLLNVDYIIVGHVLGPVALGYYSLAYRICFVPYVSISAVANGAIFPYYCRLPSREAQARTAEKAFSLINAVSIPWLAGLVLFAGDIALLGGKWAPATGAVRLLAVYAFFLSAILGNLQVLKAVGRTDLVFLGRGLHLAILTAVLVATVHRRDHGGRTGPGGRGHRDSGRDRPVDHSPRFAAARRGGPVRRPATDRRARHGSRRPRGRPAPRAAFLPFVDLAAHPRAAGPGCFHRPHPEDHAGASPQRLGDVAGTGDPAVNTLVPRGRIRTADRRLPGVAGPPRPQPWAVGAVMLAIAVSSAVVAVRWPVPALAGLALVGVLGLLA